MEQVQMNVEGYANVVETDMGMDRNKYWMDMSAEPCFYTAHTAWIADLYVD